MQYLQWSVVPELSGSLGIAVKSLQGKGEGSNVIAMIVPPSGFLYILQGRLYLFLSTIILANVPAFTIILPLKGTKTWPP